VPPERQAASSGLRWRRNVEWWVAVVPQRRVASGGGPASGLPHRNAPRKVGTEPAAAVTRQAARHHRVPRPPRCLSVPAPRASRRPSADGRRSPAAGVRPTARPGRPPDPAAAPGRSSRRRTADRTTCPPRAGPGPRSGGASHSAWPNASRLW